MTRVFKSNALVCKIITDDILFVCLSAAWNTNNVTKYYTSIGNIFTSCSLLVLLRFYYLGVVNRIFTFLYKMLRLGFPLELRSMHSDTKTNLCHGPLATVTPSASAENFFVFNKLTFRLVVSINSLFITLFYYINIIY